MLNSGMEIFGIDFNVLAITASVILAFVLGALWYSPLLFGKHWQHYVGLSDKQLEQGIKTTMLTGFVTILLMVIGYAFLFGLLALPLAVILNNDSVLVLTLVTALIIWVFTVMPAGVMLNAYAKRPWRLTAIDMAYQLLMLLITAVTFGLII